MATENMPSTVSTVVAEVIQFIKELITSAIWAAPFVETYKIVMKWLIHILMFTALVCAMTAVKNLSHIARGVLFAPFCAALISTMWFDIWTRQQKKAVQKIIASGRDQRNVTCITLPFCCCYTPPGAIRFAAEQLAAASPSVLPLLLAHFEKTGVRRIWMESFGMECHPLLRMLQQGRLQTEMLAFLERNSQHQDPMFWVSTTNSGDNILSLMFQQQDTTNICRLLLMPQHVVESLLHSEMAVLAGRNFVLSLIDSGSLEELRVFLGSERQHTPFDIWRHNLLPNQHPIIHCLSSLSETRNQHSRDAIGTFLVGVFAKESDTFWQIQCDQGQNIVQMSVKAKATQTLLALSELNRPVIHHMVHADLLHEVICQSCQPFSILLVEDYDCEQMRRTRTLVKMSQHTDAWSEFLHKPWKFGDRVGLFSGEKLWGMCLLSEPLFFFDSEKQKVTPVGFAASFEPEDINVFRVITKDTVFQL